MPWCVFFFPRQIYSGSLSFSTPTSTTSLFWLHLPKSPSWTTVQCFGWWQDLITLLSVLVNFKSVISDGSRIFEKGGANLFFWRKVWRKLHEKRTVVLLFLVPPLDPPLIVLHIFLVFVPGSLYSPFRWRWTATKTRQKVFCQSKILPLHLMNICEIRNPNKTTQKWLLQQF